MAVCTQFHSNAIHFKIKCSYKEIQLVSFGHFDIRCRNVCCGQNKISVRTRGGGTMIENARTEVKLKYFFSVFLSPQNCQRILSSSEASFSPWQHFPKVASDAKELLFLPVQPPRIFLYRIYKMFVFPKLGLFDLCTIKNKLLHVRKIENYD